MGQQSFSIIQGRNYKGCIPELLSATSTECSLLFVLVTIQAAVLIEMEFLSLFLLLFLSFFGQLAIKYYPDRAYQDKRCESDFLLLSYLA